MGALRTEKLEQRRALMEEAYRAPLIDALRECASGRWGLFGQNDGKLPGYPDARFVSQAVTTLDELGDELDVTRGRLGYREPFELAKRLADYRSQQGPNAVGEQRLALQFLNELNISE